jgi:hypothetical protein
LQSWDTKIDDADARFVVPDDFDGDPVLDRESRLTACVQRCVQFVLCDHRFAGPCRAWRS